LSKTNKNTDKSAPRHAPVESGGPSTFAGTSYQLNFATLQTLKAIRKFLHDPLVNRTIQMEPLEVGSGAITKWDVRVDPPIVFYEVKLRPTRQDMLEWFGRIRSSSDPQAEFVLVYAGGGGKLLTAFERLKALASPAFTEDGFRQLLAEYDDISGASEVLSAFGEDSFAAINHSSLEPLPENVLKENVDQHSQFLAGAKSSELADFLFKKLSDCAQSRAALRTSDLVEQIEKLGIHLESHPAIRTEQHDEGVVYSLCALQNCKVPVPEEILSGFLGIPCSEVAQTLMAPGDHVIAVRDGNYTVNPIIPRILLDNGMTVLARFLSFVLDYIRSHRSAEVANLQTDNALTLARICMPSNPESVIPLFDALEKPLKKLGNKRFVLDAAELTIAAADSKVPRDEAGARAKAKAIVCGRSWVYQRVGQVNDAEHSARESLELGKKIGWERNTAFCLKCMGRLQRLIAEKEVRAIERQNAFRGSADLLGKATEAFTALPQSENIEPDDIGDCYSLLARTYLSSGDLQIAERHAAKARDLVQNRASKDYMDLRILAGDIEAKKNNHIGAIDDYREVILAADEKDAEKSEIVARAYLQLGKSQSALGQNKAAITSFQKAENTWEALGEVEAASEAGWLGSLLEDPLSKEIEEYVSGETFFVRNLTLANYRSELADTSPSSRKRAEVPKKYIEGLIAKARKTEAIKALHW
jgi:tetratricopeptide (TPR) repeat protein